MQIIKKISLFKAGSKELIRNTCKEKKSVQCTRIVFAFSVVCEKDLILPCLQIARMLTVICEVSYVDIAVTVALSSLCSAESFAFESTGF